MAKKYKPYNKDSKPPKKGDYITCLSDGMVYEIYHYNGTEFGDFMRVGESDRYTWVSVDSEVGYWAEIPELDCLNYFDL